MSDVFASSNLRYSNGLWLGRIATRYGMIELVLGGTSESPNAKHITAIQEFMPSAGKTIEELRKRLPLSFLWYPIRLAPNNQNRVGVQFQHRFFNRRDLLFADEK